MSLQILSRTENVEVSLETENFQLKGSVTLGNESKILKTNISVLSQDGQGYFGSINEDVTNMNINLVKGALVEEIIKSYKDIVTGILNPEQK